MNQHRYSTYSETTDLSKRISRPTSAISATESHTNDYSRQIPFRRTIEPESRSSMISPIELPSSYDMFESGLPKSNSTSMLRSTAGSALGATSNPVASTSSVCALKMISQKDIFCLE